MLNNKCCEHRQVNATVASTMELLHGFLPSIMLSGRDQRTKITQIAHKRHRAGQFCEISDFCSVIIPQLEVQSSCLVSWRAAQWQEQIMQARTKRLEEKCARNSLLIPACTLIGFNQH